MRWIQSTHIRLTYLSNGNEKPIRQYLEYTKGITRHWYMKLEAEKAKRDEG